MLSNKFLISYNYGILTIKKNKDYFNIYNEFEAITNVTAIVGDNGAGKTSFLRNLINIISSNNESLNSEVGPCIVGFYDNTKNIFNIYVKGVNIQTISSSKEFTYNLVDFEGDLYKKLNSFNVLFLTNSTDSESKDSENIFININARSLIETSKLYFIDELKKIKTISINREIFEKLLISKADIKLEEFLYIKYFSDMKEKNIKFCGKTFNKIQIVVKPFYYLVDLNDYTEEIKSFGEEIRNKKFSECYFIDILFKNLLFEIICNFEDITDFWVRIKYLNFFNNDIFFSKVLEILHRPESRTTYSY